MTNKYALAPEELTAELELFDALQRLKENKDFQLVILQHYLTDEALRLTGLLGVYQTQSSGTRPHIFEELIAKSHLQNYFLSIEHAGRESKEYLDDMNSNVDDSNMVFVSGKELE